MFIILFLLLCLSILYGAVLTVIGFWGKRNLSYIITGLLLFCVPLSWLIYTTNFTQLLNTNTYKPTQAELVGEYQITEVTNLPFDKSTFDKYKLVFKSDSTFTLTPTPYITVCDSGSYELNCDHEYNEISYRCGNGFIMGSLDRQPDSFRIRFCIGDPDSGENIYFEKVKTNQK